MKVFRLSCCRLGRLLLVSALMSSTLVKSAVGEALVLHQHGDHYAHLHVVGYGDLLANAASSSKFGHCSCHGSSLRSASQRVRILAIVATGSVFVLTPRGTGIVAAALVSSENCPLVAIALPQEVPALDIPTLLGPVTLGRTASTNFILLRKHTLLL